jgi:23S rRNA (adenine2503-C2)-methyltransferase
VFEGVLIPSKKRLTACVSSQVGCSLACNFCATGTLKLERNLTSAEIYDQVFILNEEANSNFEKPLSNIVYMGMGEPLLNYKAVLNSINLITTIQGLGMSPKRITVSTVGISKMIKTLGDDKVKFNLAISLHSASDSKRDILIPLNKKINLTELREAVKLIFLFNGIKISRLLSEAECSEIARLNLTLSSPRVFIIFEIPTVETVILFGDMPNPCIVVIKLILFNTAL